MPKRGFYPNFDYPSDDPFSKRFTQGEKKFRTLLPARFRSTTDL